jgi:hypothetical protein
VSVAAAAKAYLVGEDSVLRPLLNPSPSGGQVIIGYSASRDNPREEVYGGTVVGPVELAAFAAGGRVKRSENLTLMLHIRVFETGRKTTERTDARAIEIATVIGEYIAANWKLGGLPGLLKATVNGIELNGWTEDDGAGTTLDLAIGLTSYLT